ncbi:heavy metal transporter [Seonamhaeicola sp. S2-3]|uniref:heavy-metal-associated domain-containing protein n=1 Tax=Seonamhaeicola sp. S2-3 TaxID=1936081 RepID=UPI000972866F|nr:heavy-metal-associated domain-containing protein [Seonamhaeicola sp. S2-3]APY11822.1 heavy metal transporter [Seonamhaeicola sp. S2-3]
MEITLEIQNLKCGGCANTITSKLSGLDLINNVQVNPEKNTVSFSYENDTVLDEAKTLLAKIGYPVLGDKNALTTKAKSFVSCAIGRMK